MASVIKPKRRNSSSSPPTVSDLADGEMAVNLSSKQIFVRDGSSIVEVANASGGGGSDMILKQQVFTESGTFTPSPGLLAAGGGVDVLLVGGGAGGGIAAGSGGHTELRSPSSVVLLVAEGATTDAPGQGGGIGADRRGNTSTSPGHPASIGAYGFSGGGAMNPWSGYTPWGQNAQPNTGNGGGGQTSNASGGPGGHGGGVVRRVLSLAPGTHTIQIGSGGLGTGGLGNGASGICIVTWWEKVL